MKKTRRNDSHATSACVHCRKRKTKCDGGQPACGACVRKREECEYTPDSDRRTARGRACTRCAELEAENAKLRARLAKYEASAAPASMAQDELKAALDSRSTEPPLPLPVARLDADEQPFLHEPCKLFPLDNAPLAELHPPATGQVASEPCWLQHCATPPFLPAVQLAVFDPLSACALSEFPPALLYFADADLDAHWATQDTPR